MVVRREFRQYEPANRHPRNEQQQGESAPPIRIEPDPRPSEGLEKILDGTDPAHRSAHEIRTGDTYAHERHPEDRAEREPQRPGKVRLDQGEVDEDKYYLQDPPSPFG